MQLLRLRPAFAGHEVCFVSTHRGCAASVAPDRFRLVPDANKREPLRLLASLAAVVWAVLRERPDVVVTTGAAPGLLALQVARLIGARTVWVDSIANAEVLSLSGRLAEGRTDLLLTQWPELAREDGPRYMGGVL